MNLHNFLIILYINIIYLIDILNNFRNVVTLLTGLTELVEDLTGVFLIETFSFYFTFTFKLTVDYLQYTKIFFILSFKVDITDDFDSSTLS